MAAGYRIPSDARGALSAAAVLGVITLVDDPLTTVALMAIAVPLIMFAMSRIPLRHSMLGLMYFALTLPNPNEGFPWSPWVAPFEKLGWLLAAHWNTIERSATWLKPAIFSGEDLFFVALGLIVRSRRRSRSKLDYLDAVPTPKPMLRLARISLVTTGLVWLAGMVTGGDFSMSLWQVNSVIYLPIIFLLFQEAIRGPQDFAAVLRVLCAAAVYRSLFACFVINAFTHPPDDMGVTKLAYATSHADSILFADAFAMMGIAVLERNVRVGNWRRLWVMPVFLLGMLSNNRRLVWVHLLISLLVVYLVTDDNPVKVKLRRLVRLASPAALIYVVLGWGSEYGTLFKPVRMLRSVVDASSDKTGSSYWREIENYDLVQTIFEHPVLGSGYGHGFNEVVPLPEVAYLLERFLPHNSILGLWAFCGYFGFTGVTLLWVAGVYYAMRAYRNSQDPVIRAGALSSVVGILVYVMHCWGDLGLSTWTGVFTAGASLAVAGKAAEAAIPSVPTPRPRSGPWRWIF